MNRRQMMLAAAAAGAAAPAMAQPTGPIIRTLLGDLSPSAIDGATLFHEHMSLRPGFLDEWGAYSRAARAANAPPNAPAAPARPAAPADPDRRTSTHFLSEEEVMAEEMRIAKAEGIGCLVDAGHNDMGRDVDFLRRISQASGLPIVASAGFYAQPFYPEALGGWTEDEVFAKIMAEAMANPTGALGEIGSWDFITADERKVFRAVARVHKATNIPIFTHTGIPGKSALEQLNIFEDEGVDPSRIVIGHLGNLVDEDTEVQRAIIRRGAYIGFDRQGGNGDANVVPMVKSLVDMGYTEHLMFASDLSSERESKNAGGDGYAKTLTVFAPKLREAGVPESALRTIMYENPKRFLAFEPKLPRGD